jgi:hypothetical protein
MGYEDQSESKSESKSKWDAARFFATLNYFGEVPFLGSFRWIQQWLGHSRVVPGMKLNTIQRKVAVIGDDGLELSELLKERLAPAVEVFHELLQETPEPQAQPSAEHEAPSSFPAELSNLIRTMDTLIVSNLTKQPDLVLKLVNYCEKNLSSVSGVVEQRVFDFLAADEDLSAWGALDDVVMGGVSQGSFFKRGQQAVFAGNVSTNNSGGFSSVRTRNFEPPFNFASWLGLRLRVKGDGQRYKFILRNSGGWDSPAYIYGFDTHENVWMDVSVPFDQLVPTFRARSVPDAPPFDPAKVFSFQLMLSKFEVDRQLNPKFEAGPFELAVGQVSVYRDRTAVPLIIVGAQDETIRARQRSQLNDTKVPYAWIEPGEMIEVVSAIAQALI